MYGLPTGPYNFFTFPIVALVQYGTFITALKGKLGGQYFSSVKSGQMVSNISQPSNPNTLYNQSQKQIISLLSRSWKDLTEIQRVKWSNIADLLTFYNKYNQPYIPSGYMVYIQRNSNLLFSGYPIISDSIPTIPDVAVYGITYDWTNNPENNYINLNSSDALNDWSLHFKMSKPVSCGISHLPNQLNNISQIIINAGNYSYYWANDFDLRNSCLSAALIKRKIFVQLVAISINTGQSAPPIYFSMFSPV